MSDPRVEKLAEVIVRYSVAVRPGDKVVIEGDEPGRAAAEGALRQGAAGRGASDDAGGASGNGGSSLQVCLR